MNFKGPSLDDAFLSQRITCGPVKERERRPVKLHSLQVMVWGNFF